VSRPHLTGRADGRARHDLKGKRFGRLTALRPTSKRAGGCIIWECRCDCGTYALVRSVHLARPGKDVTRSCGCLAVEMAGHRVQAIGSVKNPRRVTAFGETLTVAEWAKRTGMAPSTLADRLYRHGWTVERALTEPVRRYAERNAF